MNDIIQSLFDRKSVRVFKEKRISDEDKKLILESAIQAPSAGNQILYTIIDITDQVILDKLSHSCDEQPFIADAKMTLIFCCDYKKWYDAFSIAVSEPREPGEGEFLLGVCDALIAAQNSVVAAQSLGIGSCYIGDIMENCEYHRELLKLPKYVFPVAMLVFGYPSDSQVKRKKPARFQWDHIVHENKYRNLEEDELKSMFKDCEQRNGNKNFDFDTWMKAFYKRKYDSDFAKEMGRSINEYYKDFHKE